MWELGGQRRYHPFSAPVAGLGQLPGMLEQVTKDAAGVSQRKSLAGWMTGLERSRFLFNLSLLLQICRNLIRGSCGKVESCNKASISCRFSLNPGQRGKKM
ncbi:hypothetical protein L5D93_11600 [Paenibacillus thiaminolyticus]|nr:hypothetical protein [Paenibacillus thiaminolyticus]